MEKIFTDQGWEDYLWLSQNDKKSLKKLNDLIKDVERNGNSGIGKPEALKNDFLHRWSRRINDKDRLVYRLERQSLIIFACRTHYNEK